MNSKAKKSTWLGKTIFTILFILVLGGGAAWYLKGNTSQAKSQAQAGSSTTTETVQKGNLSLTASGSGTLVAVQSVNMGFSTSGKVAKLNVKLGDTVKAGDVLVSLENAKDLEANLATAQANLLSAQQTLATLQKSGSSALAEAYQALVQAQETYNDALNTSKQTGSARCSWAVLNQYKATLDAATQKLSDLYKSDPGSDAYTVASYDYDTAKANYNYCAAYTSTEKTSAQSELDVAKNTLQQAQDKYDTLKAASGIDPDTLSMDETKVETAQTAVDTAQEALDGITLKATIDGKITYLAGAVDAIVDTSTFLTISDISRPTVTVTLDVTDTDKLVVGNSATVTFTALPNQTFTGKVSVANPTMNSFGPFKAASGQVELDSNAAKVLEQYPLGLSATITITGKEAKNALLIPSAALKTLKNGDIVVNLVGSDGKTTQQVVTVGIKDSTNAEITSGLKEGDVISYTTSTKNSNSSSNQFGGPIP